MNKKNESNSDILSNKSVEDLRNIAVSMGLVDSNTFKREDYYNFISEGKVPTPEFRSDKELQDLNMQSLRQIAQGLGIRQSYKYNKEEIVEEIKKFQNSTRKKTKDEILREKNIIDLREIAKGLNIEKSYNYKKEELIKLILEKNDSIDENLDDFYNAKEEELYNPDKNLEIDYESTDKEEYSCEESEKQNFKHLGIETDELSDNATEIVETMEDVNYVSGILDLHQDGYGFLRTKNFLPSDGDIYVSPSQIRRFRLRNGDEVTGVVRPSKEGETFNALIYIKKVNGKDPNKAINRPYFDNLTPIYPREKIILEHDKKDIATRVIDLICPIGKGQRGLIVSQPKSGKTTLLKKIASSISANYPEIKLIVLLIDERPEEVTDMQRSVKGDVVYSTFDETPKNHTRVAEMVIDRAKRLVEDKEDVVILLDSLTRLSRAYNLITPSSGKTLSGGLDPLSLHKPKRFFGAARNIEEGGSLTILATALIETGSRMDDIIFEEFKGTGNMELHLDRKLSERRIFPAIDIYKSGTRKEEFLLNTDELKYSYKIRNAMNQESSKEITELLLDEITKTNTNKDYIKSTNILKDF